MSRTNKETPQRRQLERDLHRLNLWPSGRELIGAYTCRNTDGTADIPLEFGVRFTESVIQADYRQETSRTTHKGRVRINPNTGAILSVVEPIQPVQVTA